MSPTRKKLTDKKLNADKAKANFYRSEKLNNTINHGLIMVLSVMTVVFTFFVIYSVALYAAWMYNHTLVSDDTILVIQAMGRYILSGVGGYLTCILQKHLGK